MFKRLGGGGVCVKVKGKQVFGAQGKAEGASRNQT